MRIVLSVIGTILVLLLLAVTVLAVTFDINDWKDELSDRATAALGRDVTIDGPIEIDWGWTTSFTIEGLTIANADWAQAPHLAEIEKLEAAIRLWPLLKGRTVLPEIALLGPGLFLQQNSDGETNWTFGKTTDQPQAEDGPVEDMAKDAVVPEDRTEFPVVEALIIQDGTFEYLDETQSLDLTGSIATITGEGGGAEKVGISGKGRFEREAFEIDLSAGAFTKLRETEEPYPVDVQMRLGETEVSVSGTLTRPLELAGIDLDLAISGQSLADAFPLTGIPLPPTAPYRLTGDLVRDDQTWRFSNFDGSLGDSDLRGSVDVDLGQDPLYFEADLISSKLDFADLAGFIGAPTDDRQKDQADGLIPDTEINLDRLRAANGKAHLRAKQVIAPNLPIDDLDAQLTLADGVLRLQPTSFGVANGTINLWASLYGAQNPAQIDVLTRVRDFQLKEAFRGSTYAQETGGKIDGRIKLSGRGNSLQEMLASADGTSYMVLSEGRVSGLLLEIAGLDAMEALGLYFGADNDTKVPIRCLATDFEVESGVARSKIAVLDTQDTLIEGDGSIDLGEERLDLVFTPHPKDVSFLNFRSKVHVEGRFVDPSISLDPGSILKFVPPIDWGMADDAPCDRLINRARSEDS